MGQDARERSGESACKSECWPCHQSWLKITMTCWLFYSHIHKHKWHRNIGTQYSMSLEWSFHHGQCRANTFKDLFSINYTSAIQWPCLIQLSLGITHSNLITTTHLAWIQDFQSFQASMRLYTLHVQHWLSDAILHTYMRKRVSHANYVPYVNRGRTTCTLTNY